ncbi:hypothetical protein MMC13_007222 [Lambiella insularis]|nr:hypothetical protein [Lambiella insularis]
MFAHAWFQHREVFWNVENHEGLYIFYKTVCDVYSLIPQENYTIPIEAEGLASEPDYSPREAGQIPVDLSSSTRYGTIAEVPKQQEDGDTSATQSTGATTRRHKHTPSTGSFVTTIAEGDEDSHETPVTSIPSVDVVSTEPPSENEKYNATNTSAEPRAFANQQGEDDQLKEDAVSSLTNDVKVLEIDGKGASTEQSAPETSVAESAGERKQDSAVMTAVPKE